MSWAKLDDQFFDHPKARAVGKDGRALFVVSLCWAAGNLTDGRIRTTDLPLLAAKAEVPGPRTARKLVDAGLWEVVDNGWLIHDYHQFNPSADSERKKRAQRAQAGRLGGRTSRPNAQANGSICGSKTEAVCLPFASLPLRDLNKRTASKIEPRPRPRPRFLLLGFRVTQEAVHRQPIRGAA